MNLPNPIHPLVLLLILLSLITSAVYNTVVISICAYLAIAYLIAGDINTSKAIIAKGRLSLGAAT